MSEISTPQKKIVYSAIKPTGSLTIGHYIGAVQNWLKLQEEYNCIYMIADMHAITVDLVPAELRAKTFELMALFLALGLDPEKSLLAVQSHIKEHAELCWVLNCHTQFGEARRMTQFKEKSQSAPQNVNVGLFDYPVLMAADILLYQSHFVPIGADQRQHMELARTIAERFNNKYSPTFTMPEGIYPKYGAKVYSLSEPSVKMSKTDRDNNGYILILDSKDEIARKVRRAVTDSESEIRYDPANKPGVSNLITIASVLSGKSVNDVEKELKGANYAALKELALEAILSKILPIQSEFNRLINDKPYLMSVMKNGAENASRIASRTLSKVYRKIGFVELK